MLCSGNLIPYLQGGILFYFTSWTAVAGFFSQSSCFNQKSFRSFSFIHLFSTQLRAPKEGKKKKKDVLHRERKISCFSADFVCLLGLAHLHTRPCPFPVAEVCPAEEVRCLQDRGPQRLHGAAREGETLPSSGA